MNPITPHDDSLLIKTPPADEGGFYDAYSSFSTSLRSWLIAYGIGAPVLFASQAAFSRVLDRSDLTVPILTMFLVGVSLQIVMALIYKYSLWYIYLTIGGRLPKKCLRYKFASYITDQSWAEILIDVATIALFAIATVRLMFAYVVTVPPINPPVTVQMVQPPVAPAPPVVKP